MNVLQRIRILPLLVIVASLCLVVRAGEFAAGVRSGVAFAQQEVDADVPPLPGEEKADAATEEDHKEDDGKDGEEHAAADEKDDPEAAKDAKEPEELPSEAAAKELPDPAAEEGGEKVEWKDSSEAEFDYSKVKVDLYKDLVERRAALEKRESDLATREAVLEAAERELDQKIREMTAVRNEIESMMEQQSAEETQRVSTLVKIYEGMKAKDAARIFNTLDMDVLISVMSQMSERKSAPILAEMAPERARSVTILLAQQKQLPEIPPQ